MCFCVVGRVQGGQRGSGWTRSSGGAQITSEPAGKAGKPEASRNEDITLNSPGPAARDMEFLCPGDVHWLLVCPC